MRIRVALLVVATAVLLAAPAARADGDPASDILFADNVFLSLQPPTQTSVGHELEALCTAAKKQHFPLKVAVVAKRTDLGTAVALFGHGQAYADFLGQELKFGYPGTLLVVMGGSPGGVGVYGPGGNLPAVQKVAQTTTVPPNASLDTLARIAATAVRGVSAAAGHPLGNVSVGGSSGSSSRDRLIILAAALVLATVVGIFLPARRRRRPARTD